MSRVEALAQIRTQAAGDNKSRKISGDAVFKTVSLMFAIRRLRGPIAIPAANPHPTAADVQVKRFTD